MYDKKIERTRRETKNIVSSEYFYTLEGYLELRNLWQVLDEAFDVLLGHQRGPDDLPDLVLVHLDGLLAFANAPIVLLNGEVVDFGDLEI